MYSPRPPQFSHILECSVFVGWRNEINPSINEQMNNHWPMNAPEGIWACLFGQTDVSNTPQIEPSISVFRLLRLHWSRGLIAGRPGHPPHHSRHLRARPALSPLCWSAAPGRRWPANVTGSNLISNLINRHNVSVAGGRGFTPQVSQSLSVIPGSGPFIFLRPVSLFHQVSFQSTTSHAECPAFANGLT